MPKLFRRKLLVNCDRWINTTTCEVADSVKEVIHATWINLIKFHAWTPRWIKMIDDGIVTERYLVWSDNLANKTHR